MSNSITETSDPTLLSNLQIGDEATLIEERRQKREAIKAKYRCSLAATPDQALISDGRSAAGVTVKPKRTDKSDSFFVSQLLLIDTS